MWNERITIGIVAPEQEPKDVREMRKAILDASRNSAFIRNALDSQHYLGLNGEDAYTVLAYYALRELERQWQVNLAHLNVTPAPSVILRDADRIEGGIAP